MVQKLLREEYIKLANKYGYVPEFPTSADEILKSFGELDETGLSPLARGMKRAILLTTSSEREWAEKQLDPTGYAAILKEVLSSNLVSDSTIGRVYCAEFPTGEFNACARRARHGYLCLLNQGLRRLIYRLSVAACNRMGEQEPTDFYHSTFYHIVELCYEYLMGQPLSSKSSSEIQYSFEAIKTGGSYSGAMRTFVVAHEIAHVELGHLDSGEMKALPTPLGNIEFIEKSLNHEFEADALAQEILLRSAPLAAPRSDGQGSMLYIGGGIFFLTVEMVLSECKRIFLPNSIQINKTHPAPKDRIEALHRIIQKSASPTDYEDLKILEGIFRDIYDIFVQVGK